MASLILAVRPLFPWMMKRECYEGLVLWKGFGADSKIQTWQVWGKEVWALRIREVLGLSSKRQVGGSLYRTLAHTAPYEELNALRKLYDSFLIPELVRVLCLVYPQQGIVCFQMKWSTPRGK
jgi:hypothetical protein